MVEDNKIKSYYIENTKFSRIALAQVYEIIIEYEKYAGCHFRNQ